MHFGMKNILISVPDMQSSHCQSRVQQALANVEGLNVTQITAGTVSVTAQTEDAVAAARIAIAHAGYAVGKVEPEAAAGNALQFKTNINCGGCVAQVKPVLDAQSDIASWEVDTMVKDKILSVVPNGITADQVIEAVQKTGFKIELIHS